MNPAEKFLKDYVKNLGDLLRATLQIRYDNGTLLSVVISKNKYGDGARKNFAKLTQQCDTLVDIVNKILLDQFNCSAKPIIKKVERNYYDGRKVERYYHDSPEQPASERDGEVRKETRQEYVEAGEGSVGDGGRQRDHSKVDKANAKDASIASGSRSSNASNDTSRKQDKNTASESLSREPSTAEVGRAIIDAHNHNVNFLRLIGAIINNTAGVTGDSSSQTKQFDDEIRVAWRAIEKSNKLLEKACITIGFRKEITLKVGHQVKGEERPQP